ncbi:TadE/TadG family type IV pilus assembly protein [Sphingomonas sp. DT-207]|uniref:TadE/TadG family type IV pilus assembly protein n=1 Tax=Sphingomonas sp. DT-207 TaxID=3396167 RepID=UPI003F1BDD76
MTSVLRRLGTLARGLGRDTSGLALLEFAFSMPILLTLSLTGGELANYVVTRMRVSQVALHVADNAARIGRGSQLESKKIDEAQINDLLTGADLQAGELGLFTNGRVIVSSFEPDPAHAGKFMIRWQRCKGSKTNWSSTYGDVGDDNLDGIGPTGQRVDATEEGVTMFVEIRYEYQPIVSASLAPSVEIKEFASMMVRDRRDTSDGTGHPDGVYEVNGVTAATC